MDEKRRRNAHHSSTNFAKKYLREREGERARALLPATDVFFLAPCMHHIYMHKDIPLPEIDI